MDRISSLENTLILRILGYLPHDVVASTCVLSKRWTDLWTMVSKIDAYQRRRSSKKHITRVLLMNRSSVLDTLRLHVAQELADEMDFGAWVGWAVGRNVPELELDITDTIGLLGLHLHSEISLPRAFYQEKLLQSLSSVTRLSLALCPQRSIGDTVVFHRLVDLELNTSEDDWWDLLTCMINHCPALRILRLIGLPNSQVSSSSRKWIQPKSAPKYLETLVWKGYKLPGEREKEAVKYLVGNAKCLKRATMSIIGLNSDDKIELLNELTSVVKASNSCELLLLLN